MVPIQIGMGRGGFERAYFHVMTAIDAHVATWARLVRSEVANVRFTSGMTTTFWVTKSFAFLTISARFAGSVSAARSVIILSKSAFEYRA